MRTIILSSLMCCMLVTQVLCQSPKPTANNDYPKPPPGWVEVAKAYMNVMANRLMGWGNMGHTGRNSSMTNKDKSLMKDAVNRIEALERTMSQAKDKVSSGVSKGLGTARNQTTSWVNSALNWITGR